MRRYFLRGDMGRDELRSGSFEGWDNLRGGSVFPALLLGSLALFDLLLPGRVFRARSLHELRRQWSQCVN